MQPKTSRIVLLLLVLYGYNLITGLVRLLLYPSDPEYYLFKLIGGDYLYFGFYGLSVLLVALTFWFLWRPRPIGFWMAIAAVGWGVTGALINFFMALNRPEIVKNAYILAGQANGVPLSSDTIAAILLPTRQWLTLALAIGLNLLIAVLIYSIRDHFLEAKNTRLG